MEATTMSRLKRKRTDSSGSESPARSGSPNKRRADHTTKYPHVLVPKYSEKSGGTTSDKTKDEAPTLLLHDQLTPPVSDNMTPIKNSPGEAPTSNAVRSEKEMKILRETINTQLNLSILLKHDELRLIDQEIAKCQIALEQLRRCHEIPYPGTTLSRNVSLGTGPAVKPTGPGPLPHFPAPWGVTNGPYSRHYAKWLLPDPAFDGGELPPQMEPAAPAGKMPSKARSTRGSFTETSSVGGKSRSGRGSATGLQALSSGYPQPKGNAGPMIHKRKSDGVTVKLVCLDCRRDNFSSTQGFINHCRIAHGRNFTTHDAAADACGEPVETDESGAVIGADIPSTSTASLVHPLIRSAHLLKNRPDPISDAAVTESPMTDAPPQDHSMSNFQSNSAPDAPTKRKRGRKPKQQSPAVPTSFTPSPATPHLSALLHGRNIAIDLANAVTDAKTRVDFEESSSEDSEDESTPALPAASNQGGLTLQGGGMSRLGRTTKSPGPLDLSRKGPEKPPHSHHRKPPHRKLPETLPPTPQSSFTDLPYAHSQPPFSPQHQAPPSPPHPRQQETPAEPSPTNDSNQAPSLVTDSSSDVSDSGDSTSDSYDASRSEASETSGSSSERAESEELDVEVGDFDMAIDDNEHEDMHGGPSRARPDGMNVKPANGRRASVLKKSWPGRGRAKGEVEKHVTFVSPSPSAGKADSTEGPPKRKGGRGRRKEG
ncbi:MAG: hypothetical protein Q9227_009495 [Pyrenula ochraceoflavens]